jgi:voltage-gated potassium channel
MDLRGPNDVDTRDQPAHQTPCDGLAHERTSTLRAAVMYILSLLFLCLTGCLLPHGGVVDPISAFVVQNAWMKWALCLTWIAIAAEAVGGFKTAPDASKPALMRLLIVCLIPPFRMTISPALPQPYVWLPRQGWLRPGKEQLERLESRMALPMLGITLLILPVIGAEMFFRAEVEQSLRLMFIVYLLTACIWVAFAFEFILLISVAERKVDFCKAHWLNIVIIMLPLVAFLRTLRLFRFLRLANASKLMRVYRLRGVMTRAMRMVLIFSLLERLKQRDPYKYGLHLEEKIQEKEEELAILKAKLNEVQTTLASPNRPLDRIETP